MTTPPQAGGHSPLPWSWNERHNKYVGYHRLYDANGEPVIDSAEYEGSWLADNEHTDANAALIAAAPELLRSRDELAKALERIAAGTCDHGPQEFCPREVARAALGGLAR